MLSNFLNPLTDLIAVNWYSFVAVGVLMLAAILFILFSRLKKLPKIVLTAVCAATLVFIVVLLFASAGSNIDQPLEWNTVTLNIAAVIVCAALLVGLYFMLRRLQLNTRMLVVASLCIAIGFILSNLKFYEMPQGGSITPASMLPVMLFAWAYGPIPGIAAGIIYGALQLLQDFYVVHPAQLLLDYIFAFAALGLAGYFRKNLILGVLVAGLSRFAVHFISGVVFFGSFAPEGQNVFLYSLIYNASVVLPDTAICLIIAAIPAFRRAIMQVFKPSHEIKA